MAMPVFIKIDEYNKILEVIDHLKDKIEKAKAHLDQIDEIRRKEDAEISTWKTQVQEIEDKLNSIDITLSKPEM